MSNIVFAQNDFAKVDYQHCVALVVCHCRPVDNVYITCMPIFGNGEPFSYTLKRYACFRFTSMEDMETAH